MEEKKIIPNVFKHKKKLTEKMNENIYSNYIILHNNRNNTEIIAINSLYLMDHFNQLEPHLKRISKLIRTKIASYIQQDIKKNRFDDDMKVSINYVLEKLVESRLSCCYCKIPVVIDYQETRQMDQWTLDRVNNYIGHNEGNVLISCLQCNLQRRRIKKDHFLFTKQLVLTKTD